MQMNMQVRGIPGVCTGAPQSPLGAEACRDSPRQEGNRGQLGTLRLWREEVHSFSEGSNCPVRLTIKTES